MVCPNISFIVLIIIIVIMHIGIMVAKLAIEFAIAVGSCRPCLAATLALALPLVHRPSPPNIRVRVVHAQLRELHMLRAQGGAATPRAVSLVTTSTAASKHHHRRTDGGADDSGDEG